MYGWTPVKVHSALLTTALLVGPADQPDGTILLEPFEFRPFF